MKTIQEITDTKLEDKKVLLRTDLNLPVENGEPRKTERFYRYLETIKQLSEAESKTIILAHQGRPGRKDFLSLEKHAKHLSNELEAKVHFSENFFGQQLDQKIQEMNKGDILLLENIRFLSEELKNLKPEKHAQDIYVNKIAEKADIYINDAFSTAHRSHASIVGFNQHLEDYPGTIMKQEYQSCNKVKQEFENGVLVLGGEKTSDIVGMVQNMIQNVEKVLLGGIPGELALITQGNELGEKEKWIKENGFQEKKKQLKQLIDEHPDKIETPEDLKTKEGNYQSNSIPKNQMTWDIGDKTQQKYSEIIREADSVVMKGPMGAFEEHPEGTKKIVKSMKETSAYTVLGGGHTSSLVERFGYKLDEFNHVSIAGGAFVRFMSGEKLPGVEQLDFN